MEIQHIPAWRRLGLKLKFANDTASSSEQNTSSAANDVKRKRARDSSAVNGSNGETHQLKKARLNHESPPSKLKRNGQNEQSTPRRDSSPRRKKSVSFTPDTKVDDGDSAQTIQFWVPNSPGSTPMKPSANSNDSTEPEEPPRKPKREKKPKTPKIQVSALLPRKATAALTYLEQFHHEHASWKFNKNHETWLLKHALSTEQIPTAHNLALAFYLKGLKSTAARQRLAEQSREALNSGTDDVTSNTERPTKLLKILDDDLESSSTGSDELSWIEEMPRGQLILLSLNENVSTPNKPLLRNGHLVPKAKKNKSRTARVEVESSSDSESESEDDRGGSESKSALSKAIHKDAPDEETSSSGSSSSSSGTDSESEEESDSTSDSE